MTERARVPLLPTSRLGHTAVITDERLLLIGADPNYADTSIEFIRQCDKFVGGDPPRFEAEVDGNSWHTLLSFASERDLDVFVRTLWEVKLAKEPNAQLSRFDQNHAPANFTSSQNSSASGALGCIVGSIIAVVVVGALIGGLIGLGYNLGRNASTSTGGNNTGGSSSATTGGQIYSTSAPGECDQQGGSWTPNSHALQSCTSGGLILAGPSCPCPLGVVALTAIPSQTYPQDFVAQVTVQSLGTDPTAFWGFKFRQQSVDDSGNGRGGYAFLLAQNGQWQFNLYDADGTRHILDSGNVTSTLASTNTIEIMLNGTSFSFSVNGQLAAQETDQTYSQGVLCLAAEPGARQLFKDFTLSTAQ